MKRILFLFTAVASALAVSLQFLTMFEDARLAYAAIAAEVLTIICGTAYVVARKSAQLQ